MRWEQVRWVLEREVRGDGTCLYIVSGGKQIPDRVAYMSATLGNLQSQTNVPQAWASSFYDLSM